jgi:hypothetical protein
MEPRVIVIGYNKDFSYNEEGVVVYEAMSDRIDYIRSKKDLNFVLVPKFIHSGQSSLRKVYIERRSELPLRNFRKASTSFLHVQQIPFYNSREIEVNTIQLADVKFPPCSILYINYGNLEDIIKSAGNKFYNFKEIYIHTDVPLTQMDNVLLERYFFYPSSKGKYIHYLSQKSQLEVKTVRYSQIENILHEPYEWEGLIIICPDYYDKSILPSLYGHENVDDDVIYIERNNSRLSDIFMFSSIKNMKTLAQCILEKKITTTNKLSNHLNLKIFLKE